MGEIRGVVYPKQRMSKGGSQERKKWKECTSIQTAKGSEGEGRKDMLTERKRKSRKMEKKGENKEGRMQRRKEGKQLPINNMTITAVNRK